MFKKKNTTLNTAADNQLLMEAMDRIIAGDYTPVEPESFSNPLYGQKVNDLVIAFKRTNNNFVMRMNEAMEQIGNSSLVKEMMEHVTSQSSAIQEMTTSSKGFESSTMRISDEVNYIKEATQTAIQVSQSSVVNMNNTISSVKESVSEIRSINDKVQDFHDKIEEVTNIIDMIKKIANQSGLLALNASIEAARAGEAGKGFAVVANQVKELSSNTTRSAETVVKYVSELQMSISELMDLVNNTTSHLEDSNDKVQQSVNDMNRMDDHMQTINDRIDSITDAVHAQSVSTETFIKSIDSIAGSYETLRQDCFNTGEHFYRIGRYVDTTRSDMARGFSDLTTQDWIRVFQIDHLIFTYRVYNNIIGFEHLKITQLNNPKGCKFGLWVGKQTDPKIVNNQIFKDLVKYHETLHKYACDSWYAAEDGNRESAMEYFNLAFENYQKFFNTIGRFKEYMRTIGYADETEIVVFRK